jgi:hypothetical protein
VHPQFTGRFDLVAILVSEGGHQKRLPELPHGFGVENPALVHLVYQCVEFASHNARSLKCDEGMMARTLRWPVGAVNYLNAVQRELGGVFHNCTRAGH